MTRVPRHYRFVTSLLCLVLLGGCASLRGKYQGEHLVIPFIEELKTWQLFQKSDKTYRANMWQKPGAIWADTFAVSIYYQKTVDFESQRVKMDAPGKEHCDSFESVELEHPKLTHDPIIYWQTTCINSDEVVARMLHLMIDGEESFYHIQKIWKSNPSDEDFRLWIERLDDTFLCIMGTDAKGCPN